jgi:hypothetical protein
MGLPPCLSDLHSAKRGPAAPAWLVQKNKTTFRTQRPAAYQEGKQPDENSRRPMAITLLTAISWQLAGSQAGSVGMRQICKFRNMNARARAIADRLPNRSCCKRWIGPA